MRTILPLFVAIISLSDTFKDVAPDKIIKADIETLKTFDKTIYNLANKKHKSLSIPLIYRFISNHRALVNDYSKIKAFVRGELGSRTRRALTELEEDYTLIDEMTNSREYYAVAVAVSYPLYDKKTEKTIRNERIVQNSKILDYISLYVEALIKLQLFNDELEIIQLIQIRDKSLVKTGMKYLDERIKTIERLHATRANIAKETIRRDKLKQKLLTLTTDPVGLDRLL